MKVLLDTTINIKKLVNRKFHQGKTTERTLKKRWEHVCFQRFLWFRQLSFPMCLHNGNETCTFWDGFPRFLAGNGRGTVWPGKTHSHHISAICKNIQHSLACYEDGHHFRHLYTLYEPMREKRVIHKSVLFSLDSFLDFFCKLIALCWDSE